MAASIAAMDQKGLANTDIGAGLAMGLAQLDGDAGAATKAVLLVTDGAGVIADQTQKFIRAEAQRLDAHFYYLYLRAGDDPPLAEDIGDDINLGRPSGLDAFLRNLGVTYAAFEGARSARRTGGGTTDRHARDVDAGLSGDRATA